MELLQKWIVELYLDDMNEQQQRWSKSDLYRDVDNIALTYNLEEPEIYTIKRYLGDFFRASSIGRYGLTSVLLTDEMISTLQVMLPS